jgi:hypothetical protein
MRHIIRLSAFAAAFMLSREQARFFDCNKMPGLSVMSGTVTLLRLRLLRGPLPRCNL